MSTLYSSQGPSARAIAPPQSQYKLSTNVGTTDEVDFLLCSLYIYPCITTIPATVGIGLATRTSIRGGVHQLSC